MKLQKELKSNPKQPAVKKGCGPKKAIVKKRCKIQGGGQEMAVMVAKFLITTI